MVALSACSSKMFIACTTMTHTPAPKAKVKAKASLKSLSGKNSGTSKVQGSTSKVQGSASKVQGASSKARGSLKLASSKSQDSKKTLSGCRVPGGSGKKQQGGGKGQASGKGLGGSKSAWWKDQDSLSSSRPKKKKGESEAWKKASNYSK